MRILCGLVLRICHWVGHRTPRSDSQQSFLFSHTRKATPAISHREYLTGPVITFRDLVVHVPTKDGSRSAPTTTAKAAATIRTNVRSCFAICANLNTSLCGVWSCRAPRISIREVWNEFWRTFALSRFRIHHSTSTDTSISYLWPRLPIIFYGPSTYLHKNFRDFENGFSFHNAGQQQYSQPTKSC